MTTYIENIESILDEVDEKYPSLKKYYKELSLYDYYSFICLKVYTAYTIKDNDEYLTIIIRLRNLLKNELLRQK